MKNFIEWASDKDLLEGMPMRASDDDEADDELDDEEYPNEKLCPMCRGPLQFLGKLGCMDHFRCRNCGMMTNRDNGTCG